MIDLDGLDEQLTSAVTVGARPGRGPAVAAETRPAPRPPGAGASARVVRDRRRAGAVAVPAPSGPRPASGPEPASCAPDLRRLVELGRFEQADAQVAADSDRCHAAAWATMRALLAGERDAFGAGLSDVLELARATGEAAVRERYWAPRLWAALEWGDDAERYDVLDHCRERAYRFDELEWWANLTLLLATMGKADEAARAFDATAELLARAARGPVWLDAATNLVEGAFLLGDPGRAALVPRTVLEADGQLVVVGPAAVCKGSIERYRALVHAAAGRWTEAADGFRAAASAHRAIGAGPLLARTLAQAERVHVAA